MVIVNLISLHYDPKTWDKPGMFIPERFLTAKSETDSANLNPSEYSPFGHSKRFAIKTKEKRKRACRRLERG